MQEALKVSEAAPLMQILVVEDNMGDAFLLVKFLEHSKFPNHVTVVRDGEHASDFIKKKGEYTNAKRPDLVFLDLNLPRKDGRTVRAEIQENP
jgi:CheY-like chemotaxis protein